MAVENKYGNSNVAAGKFASAAVTGGDKLVALVSTFEVAAGDSDTSIYRVGASLNPDLIPIQINIYADAMTSASDYDLGLYAPGTSGAVVDADVFVDGADISAGKAITAPQNGLADVDIANLGKRLYEHAGHTIKNRLAGYDLALTANTVGTDAGTITVVALFVQG